MLLNSESTYAVLVIALSGSIAAMVANGRGALALGRIMAGVMSNPVPNATKD